MMINRNLKIALLITLLLIGLLQTAHAFHENDERWSEWYILPGMAKNGLQFRIGNPVEDDGYIIADLEYRNVLEDWDIYACFWTDPFRYDIKSEHYNKNNPGLLFLAPGESKRIKHKILFQKNIEENFQISKWDSESFLYKTVYPQQSQEEKLTRDFLEVQAWIWKEKYGDSGFLSKPQNVVKKGRAAFKEYP